MATKQRPTDTVRASRDGHEYHETWVARKSLQLLLPGTDLAGIAVEGLHPTDESDASAETVQIADVVLYFGNRPTFTDSNETRFVQVKYSISDRDVDFRASHAKKTIAKFAVAYLDFRKKHGVEKVRKRLKFEIITNRPIYPAFVQAIRAIASGQSTTGEVKKQVTQLRVAAGLDGKCLVEFASKLTVSGLMSSLGESKGSLTGMLVNWSATSDAMARARLGTLRQMVRDKAGYAGTNQ